jgi:hypothetical protein
VNNGFTVCCWFCCSSSSSIGPVANATDVLEPSRLIVLTLFPPPVWRFSTFLVAKGRTMWARINRKFCLRLRLPRQFRDLLHAANLRHGTHGFTSLPKESVLRIFFALKNPEGFGRVWTRELGYLKAACYPQITEAVLVLLFLLIVCLVMRTVLLQL